MFGWSYIVESRQTLRRNNDAPGIVISEPVEDGYAG